MAWLWLSCVLLSALMAPVAANTPPSFQGTLFVVLPEDLPVGNKAFQLSATDRDGDKVTYGISGLYAYFFNVNSSTGEATLASPLDYETQTQFRITVSASDGYLQVQREMLVIIEDRNDNAPVFQNTGFSADISETLPVGSLVYSVLAEDKDTGSSGIVEYNLTEIIPSTADRYLFYILDNGSIILNGSLSYNNKSAFYQLKLVACDSGGLLHDVHTVQCSSPVFLSITVIDQPDLDPQFIRDFYSASVAEDAALGTSVLTVEAVDSDKGVNDLVLYSISNSTRVGWFDIGVDGVIRVSGPLDREQLLQEDEEVQLQVTATEKNLNIYEQQAQASIWVTLVVTDVNDHTPEFYSCNFSDCTFSPQEVQADFVGYVDEHASTRIPIDNLTMAAYDPDKGRNGTFQLTLAGADANAFSVSPERVAGSAEVQVLVRAPQMVDYENKTVMQVQVVATDSASQNSSTATVTIHIRDINDHRPSFPQSSYVLCLPEHSAAGFVVTSDILATDPDTGDWGRITYSLLPGNGADLFAVDTNSGMVTVRDGKLLDREKQAVYYLTLQATDGGDLSTSTSLEINLLDINDNAPQVSGSYNVFVREEEEEVSVTIQAQDIDELETDNSRLVYSLLPGPYSHNFSLGPDTELLTNVGPLDREEIDRALEGRIMLTVQVADCGTPSLSTEVNITITVEDINDNPPVFNQSSYTFSVMEQDPGALVGVVEAEDKDQTEVNNRISFSLSGSGVNNFILQGSVLGSGVATGSLWLPPDQSLDHESQAVFRLTVSAENLGSQGLAAQVDVTVMVLDINDEPPTLVEASLQGVRVAENSSRDGQVAQVQARDVDSNAWLQIELVGVICTKAGVDVGDLCRTWFSMENGSVYISQGKAIDYEACDLVTLVVQACDLNTDLGFPACSDRGSLDITIEDVNDNAPYFVPENKTFVIIPELVLPGQQVATVQARDDDSGANGAVKFNILHVNFVSNDGTTQTFQNIFNIVPSSEGAVFTGSIELMTNLDSALQGIYQVTVQAQDTPSVGSALESQLTLNLFTVDQSYRVRLQFSMYKDEVGANLEAIKQALAQATRTTVYVVHVQDLESMARARANSYMDAYFVFPNGSALMLSQLSSMIRSDEDALTELLRLGLVVLGSQEPLDSDQRKQLVIVIVGLGVALALTIVIATTVFVCVQKSHRRKLRAMKAAKEARQTAAGVTSFGAAIPGTNIYKTEKANPMLNLSANDLGLEYLSSNDLDHVSLNSLDDNSVDLDKDSRDNKQEPPPPNPQRPYAEPLSMLLSARQPTEGQQQNLSFTNGGLDTTDL
ncbi:cadherin-related family member 2 isoform X2 [Ochotona curzoniae]|uniref:cadherin-related family member 2 isoform X2 n=1 Tax=Ochotona curzoniae TaxID=130825 RepID=UPI001B352C56|nr:cadherin-related family member 2 isoform X2 [Ochotona curzoniae]